MKELEKENLKNEIEKLDKMNSEGFSGFSKALQAEVLDIKNRKFKEYMIDVLENEIDDDRSVVLMELSKKNITKRRTKRQSCRLLKNSEDRKKSSNKRVIFLSLSLQLTH